MLGGRHFTKTPCLSDHPNNALLGVGLPLQAILTAGRTRGVSIGTHPAPSATLWRLHVPSDRFSCLLNAIGRYSGDHGCAKAGRLEDRRVTEQTPAGGVLDATPDHASFHRRSDGGPQGLRQHHRRKDLGIYQGGVLDCARHAVQRSARAARARIDHDLHQLRRTQTSPLIVGTLWTQSDLRATRQ